MCKASDISSLRSWWWPEMLCQTSRWGYYQKTYQDTKSGTEKYSLNPASYFHLRMKSWNRSGPRHLRLMDKRRRLLQERQWILFYRDKYGRESTGRKSYVALKASLGLKVMILMYHYQLWANCWSVKI